ncbi:hypothetical protein CRUP_021918 [Coryphaenoides rupestris]|nr:hypothetical protein CRUP_021918 [Coryphaenoides rupestris]
MDHTLFGCLRSPHAPAQALHPAFTHSPLTLHGRSDHVSYPDPSSSPATSSPSPCIVTGYPSAVTAAADDGLFSGQHHHHHHHHLHHPHHPSHRGNLPPHHHHQHHQQQQQQQQQQHAASQQQQHQAHWHIPQMPSPGNGNGGSRHVNLCHPQSHAGPDAGPGAEDLGPPGGPGMCASTPSLGGSSSPHTGTTCAPVDFGRQTLSPAEAEKRNGKRKSDSSGERMRRGGEGGGRGGRL